MKATDTAEPGFSDIGRRELLRRFVLVLVAAPLLSLRETVARAERRRRNHRGHSDELWIGHC